MFHIQTLYVVNNMVQLKDWMMYTFLNRQTDRQGKLFECSSIALESFLIVILSNDILFWENLAKITASEEGGEDLKIQHSKKLYL